MFITCLFHSFSELIEEFGSTNSSKSKASSSKSVCKPSGAEPILPTSILYLNIGELQEIVFLLFMLLGFIYFFCSRPTLIFSNADVMQLSYHSKHAPHNHVVSLQIVMSCKCKCCCNKPHVNAVMQMLLYALHVLCFPNSRHMYITRFA